MANKFSKISIDIITVLALAGVIAIGATSPYFLLNVAKAIGKKNRRFRSRYNQAQTARAVDRLRRSRMIILKEENDKFLVELTEKGKRKVKEIAINELKNKKPEDWDGLWRLVIFDIPENQKLGRSAIRGKMKEIGFYGLQKSVWVFPYDCEKEIELLVELFDIFPYVNLVEAKRIKNDIKLRKYFGLIDKKY